MDFLEKSTFFDFGRANAKSEDLIMLSRRPMKYSSSRASGNKWMGVSTPLRCEFLLLAPLCQKNARRFFAACDLSETHEHSLLNLFQAIWIERES